MSNIIEHFLLTEASGGAALNLVSAGRPPRPSPAPAALVSVVMLTITISMCFSIRTLGLIYGNRSKSKNKRPSKRSQLVMQIYLALFARDQFLLRSGLRGSGTSQCAGRVAWHSSLCLRVCVCICVTFNHSAICAILFTSMSLK